LKQYSALLRDDGLVTKLSVATDRLLRPTAERFDIVAIIAVIVKATKLTYGNFAISD